MTSAIFRLGTATSNSAGTTWTWGSYDGSVTAAVSDYVKCELQSTIGVDSVAFSLISSDEDALSALPAVTYTASTRTATFRVSTSANVGHTYLVRSLVNGGVDRNGDTDAALDKRLAVHVLTQYGYKLFAVDETDESNRTYGYTDKLNDLVRYAGSVAGSGSGAVLPGGTAFQHLEHDGATWDVVSDITLPADGARAIKLTSGSTARTLTIQSNDATGANNGGTVVVKGGDGNATPGGDVYIKGGNPNAGEVYYGSVYLGNSECKYVIIGDATDACYWNDGTHTLKTSGDATIDLPLGTGSTNFKIDSVAVSDNVTATNLNTLTAGPASNADTLHTHANEIPSGSAFQHLEHSGAAWLAVSDIALPTSGNRTISITSGSTARTLTLKSNDATSTNYGGDLYLKGGDGNATPGGDVYITGGNPNAGEVYYGSVYLGNSECKYVIIGDATDACYWNDGTHTLQTSGDATIDLPLGTGSTNFKIDSVAVSDNVTATNLNTLTSGATSNADALHTHALAGRITYALSQSNITDENGTPVVCGAAYIDPATWVGTPQTITFRAVVDSTDTGTGQVAVMDLYDVDGRLDSGTPGTVTGSQVDNSGAADPTVASVVSATITSAASALATAGIFEARLWIDTPDTVNSVSCKSAVVIVDFTS